MAIAFDAASEAYSASTTSLVIPHTCSGANRHLTLGAVLSEVAAGTATYNGVALSQVAINDFAGGTDVRLVLLDLIAPATGTHDVVITLDTATEIWAGVVSRTGVDQTTPISGVTSDSVGSGSSHNFDVPSAAGDLAIGLAGTTSDDLASGAGQTTRAVKSPQANGEYNGLMDDEPGAALVNLAYTWRLNRFASFIGASLAPSAAGPVALAATLAGEGDITASVDTGDVGAIGSLDDLVAGFGWLLDTDDQTITFRHLLNMTSSYGYGAEAAGDAFAYGNSGAGLLSETLKAIGGNNLDAIAVPLFGPLQLEDSPNNIFEDSGSQGIVNNMTPRDFARVGWMLANRGAWSSGQVVSQDFFAPLAEFGQLGDRFGHVQVPNTVPVSSATFTPGDYLDVSGFATPPENETPHGPGVFGLGWYLNGTAPGPVQQWAGLPADTMVTTGIFGTAVLIIIPSTGLVVAVADPTTTNPADVLGNIAPPSSVDPQFNDTVALLTGGITGPGLAPTFPATTWTDITDAEAGIGTTALDDFTSAVTFSASTRGVVTRNGHMVRTFGDQTTPVWWASSRKALYGVLVGAVAAGDVAAPWEPTLIDTFTGANGSPPDPAHWTIVTDGDGIATAEIQGDELELAVDATGATVVTEAAVNSAPGTGALLDTRIDFEFRFPTGATRCFANIRLRKEAGATGDRYQVFLQRASGTQSATIRKDTAGGGSEDFGTALSLDGAEAHWRGRFQVAGTNPPQLKLAVRDFDLGPIPDGTWDREVVDPGTTPFLTTPNPVELANAEGVGQTTAMQLDNVVIAEPAEVAPGAVELAATLAGEGAVAADLTVARPLAASLAGLGVLTARLTAQKPLRATLAGSGDVVAGVQVSKPLGASLAGSGVLAVDLTVSKQLSSTLAGAAAVVADLDVTGAVRLAATLAGEGALVANLRARKPLSATLAGEGVVQVSAAVTRRLAAALTGEGTVVAALATASEPGHVQLRRVLLTPAVGVEALRLEASATAHRARLRTDVQVGGLNLEPNGP